VVFVSEPPGVSGASREGTGRKVACPEEYVHKQTEKSCRPYSAQKRLEASRYIQHNVKVFYPLIYFRSISYSLSLNDLEVSMFFFATTSITLNTTTLLRTRRCQHRTSCLLFVTLFNNTRTPLATSNRRTESLQATDHCFYLRNPSRMVSRLRERARRFAFLEELKRERRPGTFGEMRAHMLSDGPLPLTQVRAIVYTRVSQ
jgi:hypothetical protein